MTTTDTPQMKLASKYKAIQKMKAKRVNVSRQIEIYQTALENLEEDLAKSETEYDQIQLLLGELETLEKKKAKNVTEMNRLLDHYNAIEWSPDMPEADKISSSNFDEISAETSIMAARIVEIPKEINRVYYRR